MKKRAISPIVASVLLVALVLVLASIVFIWAKGFIGEQVEKGDKPVASLCEEVSFSVDLIEDDAVAGTYEVEIVNRGNYAIYNFLIIKTLDGSEASETFAFAVDAQGSISQEADLRIDGKVPEEVAFYPALLGTVVGESSNRPYTCTENGVTKTL